MKKLLDLPPHVQAKLLTVEQAIVRAQDSDPQRFTYVCPDCQDTGFRVVTRTHRFMGGPYVVGVPCDECMAGMRIADGIAKEEASRPVRTLRPRNERIRLVPHAEPDYTGEEPSF